MSSCEIVLYKLNPCAMQRILYDRFDRAYGRLLVDTENYVAMADPQLIADVEYRKNRIRVRLGRQPQSISNRSAQNRPGHADSAYALIYYR